MRRGTAIALTMAALASGQAFAPSGSLKFEVATIKPSLPGTEGGGVRPAPGGRRFVGSGVTLRAYLLVAYQVKPEQILGGPDWVDTAYYDLNAEAEKPSSIQDLHIMLQSFLAERFKLQVRFEKKEMQAYMLMVDKGGPRNLKARPSAPGADFALDRTAEQPFHEKFKAHCVSMESLGTWAAFKPSRSSDHQPDQLGRVLRFRAGVYLRVASGNQRRSSLQRGSHRHVWAHHSSGAPAPVRIEARRKESSGGDNGDRSCRTTNRRLAVGVQKP